MQQIADWLEKLGMSEYAQRFAENRIDLSVLPELTDQHLKDLGIALGDRLKMLRATKNRRTILKEAEQHVGAKYVDQVLDSLYVIESAMRHFYVRAEMRKRTNDKPHLIDADYEKAAHFAALVAPYRHARLSAVKLAGDPNNSARFKDDASADELRDLNTASENVTSTSAQ